MKLADKEVDSSSREGFPKKIIDAAAYLIIALAACLRLFDFTQWSLSNDELSSWSRVQYQDLASLIELGVRPDGHPALNQIFLYFWLKIVPDTPIMIRLPYVLLSILGLYLFYGFARKMIGKKAALPFLISLSFSFLFVVYHQIARPYALGFFVIAAFSYCWINYIKNEKNKYLIGYILLGAISLYTHYILALSSLCLAIAGLFLLYNRKRMFLRYLLANVLIVILFLPHLGITLDQFSLGGLNWLSKPKGDFLWEFSKYSLNDSLIYILLILLPLILAFGHSNRASRNSKKWILPLLFFVPYFIIYFYSLEVKPIIQFSLLIFSFPFLLLFLFSFTEGMSPKSYLIFNCALLAIAIVSLFYPNHKLSAKPFANFEGVAKKIIAWEKEMDDNLLVINSANNPKYLAYYFDQFNFEDDSTVTMINGRENLESTFSKISQSHKEYLALSFANLAAPPELYEYSRIHFPRLIARHKYFNSEALLLSKTGPEDREDQSRTFSFLSVLSDRHHADRWEVRDDLYEDSLFYSAPAGFSIGANDPYSLTFRAKIKNIFKAGSKWLCIKAKMKSESKNGFHLTVSTSRGEEQIDWRSVECDLYHRRNAWYNVVMVYQIPESALPDDDLAVYFWNPESGSALIDDVKLINYKDSDFDYYQLP